MKATKAAEAPKKVMKKAIAYITKGTYKAKEREGLRCREGA